MDGSGAPPTTSSVAGLFSTVAGDISADTVNSVISDLNLFRAGPVSTALPHWESNSPSGQSAMNSLSSSSMHCDPGPSHEVCSVSGVPTEAGHRSSGLGAGLGSQILDLPMTPPTSDSGPPSAETSNHGNQSDSDREMPPRKKRTPVPNEKKDERYWDRRRKNNIAAKRSREIRRKKMDDELKQAKEAIQENQKLKQEIEVLKAEINSLRRLLKDANMTLSLWIRAKQTSEPNAQLPPMLRGPNVPFVNFPVSSAV